MHADSVETAGHKQRTGREGLQLAPSALSLQLEVGLRWEGGDPGGGVCRWSGWASPPGCLGSAFKQRERASGGCTQVRWLGSPSRLASVAQERLFHPKPRAARAAPAPDPFIRQGRAAVLVTPTGILTPGPWSHHPSSHLPPVSPNLVTNNYAAHESFFNVWFNTYRFFKQ